MAYYDGFVGSKKKKRKWTVRKAIENPDALQFGDWVKGYGDLDSHATLELMQFLCKEAQAEIEQLQMELDDTQGAIQIAVIEPLQAEIRQLRNDQSTPT